MAAISRSQALKELLPGLNALFGLEYDKYENEHTEIFDTESSDRSFEEEVKIAGFTSAPTKQEGAPVWYDTAQESFTARYVHETIAMAFAVTEEAMEDNLYEKLSSRYTKAMAKSMAHTKQVKAAAWLNNGFSGTTYLTGDGQNVFDTDHVLVVGTIANRPSTAVDLNETSLEAAVIAIQAWTDDRGLLIAEMPRKLIIPPSLQFVATRLLETEKRVGTADNDINAIKTNGVIPEGYRVNHFLTDTDAWFLKTTVTNGFKHFVRIPVQTSNEGDFDTGNFRYKCRERYSFGVSDFLAMYGSPGA